MKNLHPFLFIPFLILFALSGSAAFAWDDEDDFRAPTPPRLSFIDGRVSYWRSGAEDWVDARRNLPLAEGDALYAGDNSNFEVQFDSRRFVRADENTELSLLLREPRRLPRQTTSTSTCVLSSSPGSACLRRGSTNGTTSGGTRTSHLTR